MITKIMSQRRDMIVPYCFTTPVLCLHYAGAQYHSMCSTRDWPHFVIKQAMRHLSQKYVRTRNRVVLEIHSQGDIIWWVSSMINLWKRYHSAKCRPLNELVDWEVANGVIQNIQTRFGHHTLAVQHIASSFLNVCLFVSCIVYYHLDSKTEICTQRHARINELWHWWNNSGWFALARRHIVAQGFITCHSYAMYRDMNRGPFQPIACVARDWSVKPGDSVVWGHCRPIKSVSRTWRTHQYAMGEQ